MAAGSLRGQTGTDEPKFGCVIAQAFFSRRASESSLKSRVFSAEFSGI